MDNQKESKDDLEYNDDLGDLLRERKKLEFSWVKTSIVVVASLAIILLGLTLVFKTGKQYIVCKNDTPTTEKHVVLTSKQLVDSTIKEKAVKKPITNAKKAVAKKPVAKKKVVESKPVNASWYKVITGSFKNKEFAVNQRKTLKKKGIKAFIRTNTFKDGSTMYRIQAGAYKTREQAETFQRSLAKKKIDSYLVIK